METHFMCDTIKKSELFPVQRNAFVAFNFTINVGYYCDSLIPLFERKKKRINKNNAKAEQYTTGEYMNI